VQITTGGVNCGEAGAVARCAQQRVWHREIKAAAPISSLKR
jgi:hypothetical protein